MKNELETKIKQLLQTPVSGCANPILLNVVKVDGVVIKYWKVFRMCHWEYYQTTHFALDPEYYTGMNNLNCLSLSGHCR